MMDRAELAEIERRGTGEPLPQQRGVATHLGWRQHRELAPNPAAACGRRQNAKAALRSRSQTAKAARTVCRGLKPRFPRPFEACVATRLRQIFEIKTLSTPSRGIIIPRSGVQIPLPLPPTQSALSSRGHFFFRQVSVAVPGRATTASISACEVREAVAADRRLRLCSALGCCVRMAMSKATHSID